MKVYGVIVFGPGGQYRAVVAAKSYQSAADALGVKASYLRDFGSKTGNQQEIDAAMSKPGSVFWRSTRDSWDAPLKERAS